jgi:hypothetical protein
MRRSAVGLILIAALCGPGCGVTPIEGEPFASCAQAKAAVARAGHEGLLIGRDPDRIYGDAQCYRNRVSDTVSAFEKQYLIAGERCTVGYFCMRTGGGGAGP